MQILVFGSQNDKQAWDVADKIENEFPRIEFVKTSNVEDILNVNSDMIIMDVVKGIKEPCLLGIDDLKDRRLSTLHDFDVGFFLKLLKQIGRTNKTKIIGIPMKIDKRVIEEIRLLIK